MPLLFFDIGIYGDDIEKEYEKLNKYIQARERDLQYAKGNDSSYCIYMCTAGLLPDTA
ncbi:MAG: hypothetical protein LBD46_00520 [Endomicrobium sp.]|jgi:hypothetical protein|nr:hypothetical protein [Endomicrobium sp.]